MNRAQSQVVDRILMEIDLRIVANELFLSRDVKAALSTIVQKLLEVSERVRA